MLEAANSISWLPVPITLFFIRVATSSPRIEYIFNSTLDSFGNANLIIVLGLNGLG